MIRRINFFAGAGCGKSGISAHIYASLKKRHYEVELVREKIKVAAYQGIIPISYAQAHYFNKQLRAEDVLLQHVQAILTDSPLLLNAAYSTFYNFKGARHLIGLAEDFEEDFPSINFLLKREVPYRQKGRYQSEEESKKFDSFMLDFLSKNLKKPLIEVSILDEDDIIAKILAVPLGKSL